MALDGQGSNGSVLTVLERLKLIKHEAGLRVTAAVEPGFGLYELGAEDVFQLDAGSLEGQGQFGLLWLRRVELSSPLENGESPCAGFVVFGIGDLDLAVRRVNDPGRC